MDIARRRSTGRTSINPVQGLRIPFVRSAKCSSSQPARPSTPLVAVLPASRVVQKAHIRISDITSSLGSTVMLDIVLNCDLQRAHRGAVRSTLMKLLVPDLGISFQPDCGAVCK